MKLTKMTKKFLAAAVVASVAVTAVAWPAPVAADDAQTSAKAYSTADTTGDGQVKLDDAQLALQFALGIKNPTADEAKAADVVAEPEGITLEDAKEILLYALGIKPIPDAPMETATPAPETQTPGTTTPPIVFTFTPAPTSIPLPEVEPGTPVTGTAIEVASEADLHGATFENGIYTFTDANKEADNGAGRGIKMTNPWAGNTALRQTVTDALPSFFVDEAGSVVGKVVGDKLIALDGSKKVIATWKADTTVTDGAIAVMIPDAEEVTGDAVDTTAEAATADAVDTTADAVEVKGKIQKWNYTMIPADSRVAGKYNPAYAELYVRPEWTNGVSISFWVKADWSSDLRTDSYPLLVIKDSSGCDKSATGEFSGVGHTGDFAFMLKLNGMVSFEGDQTGNNFRTVNHFAGNDGVWNYYTVTFANDWITVYVNGQELVYYSVELDKDNIGYFNNGFMTRYSTVYDLLKDDVIDERNYLAPGWVAKDGAILSRMDVEYTIIGNSRYSNPDACTVKKEGGIYELLVDALVDDNTEIWFGSSSLTQCTCLTSTNTGSSAYKVKTGTQIAEVYCYDTELTAEEVAANYEKEYAANEAKFALSQVVGPKDEAQ